MDKKSPAYQLALSTAPTIHVIAGPGTGKTYGLTRRIARLLEEGEEPERILAVTFTRIAARDLKTEIRKIGKKETDGIEGSDQVVACTLHSLCRSILTNYHVMRDVGRTLRPLFNFEQTPMLYDLNVSSEAMRDMRKHIRTYESSLVNLLSEETGSTYSDSDKAFAQEVSDWLKAHNAMLFGEMITEALGYLRANPTCPEKMRFRHILVDEYQDLNKAEQEVIEQLVPQGGNLVVIGDDDQSIYGFKDAHPEGIRTFPKNRNCPSIPFDMCRRCPPDVTDAASNLIRRNGTHNALEPNTEYRISLSEPPKEWKTSEAQIQGIADMIKKAIDDKEILPQDVLILVPGRTDAHEIAQKMQEALKSPNFEAKNFLRESALTSRRLEYKFSLLGLMAHPRDTVSLRYVLGYGDNSFRAESYKLLQEYAEKKGISVYSVLEKSVKPGVTLPVADDLVKVYKRVKKKMEDIKKAVAEDPNSLVDTLTKNKSTDRVFRDLLIAAISTVRDTSRTATGTWLRGIHRKVSIQVSSPDIGTKDSPDDGEKDKYIKIMSLHASKGLSAKYVVVMNVNRDILPAKYHGASAHALTRSDHVKEQRRLFYVAVTRCKGSSRDEIPLKYAGKLIISTIEGNCSKFISELGEAPGSKTKAH